MRKETIIKNTPISGRKARVFNALVNFYEVSSSIGMKLSEKQEQIKTALENYENEGKRIPDFSNESINSFDKHQFSRFVPCHRRKRAMFYALLVFLDELGESRVSDFKTNNLFEVLENDVKLIDAFSGVMESANYFDGEMDYREGWRERLQKELDEEEESEKSYCVTLKIVGEARLHLNDVNADNAKEKAFEHINELLKNELCYYKIEMVDVERE